MGGNGNSQDMEWMDVWTLISHSNTDNGRHFRFHFNILLFFFLIPCLHLITAYIYNLNFASKRLKIFHPFQYLFHLNPFLETFLVSHSRTFSFSFEGWKCRQKQEFCNEQNERESECFSNFHSLHFKQRFKQRKEVTNKIGKWENEKKDFALKWTFSSRMWSSIGFVHVYPWTWISDADDGISGNRVIQFEWTSGHWLHTHKSTQLHGHYTWRRRCSDASIAMDKVMDYRMKTRIDVSTTTTTNLAVHHFHSSSFTSIFFCLINLPFRITFHSFNHSLSSLLHISILFNWMKKKKKKKMFFNVWFCESLPLLLEGCNSIICMRFLLLPERIHSTFPRIHFIYLFPSYILSIAHPWPAYIVVHIIVPILT